MRIQLAPDILHFVFPTEASTKNMITMWMKKNQTWQHAHTTDPWHISLSTHVLIKFNILVWPISLNITPKIKLLLRKNKRWTLSLFLEYWNIFDAGEFQLIQAKMANMHATLSACRWLLILLTWKKQTSWLIIITNIIINATFQILPLQCCSCSR